MSKTVTSLAIASALAATLATSPLLASQGSLDVTFGSNGMQSTSFSAANDVARASALQPDGRLIVAGFAGSTNGSDFALLRYLADGTLDTTFGGDGKVTTRFGTLNRASVVEDVAVQDDGKIIAVGHTGGSAGQVFALVRYTAEGALDPTFGSNGIVTLGIRGRNDILRAVAVQPDGRIVVAGWSENTTSPTRNRDVALARFMPDGSRDHSFGTEGIVLTQIGPSDDGAEDLELLDDGRIMIGGFSCDSTSCDRRDGRYNFAFARYLSDGTLDPSFQDDGRRIVTPSILQYSSGASAIAVQEDGGIVAAGGRVKGDSNFRQGEDFALVRLDAHGQIDHGFGDRGWVKTPIGLDGSSAFDVAYRGDGRLVAAGASLFNTTNTDFTVVLYNKDGSIDQRFGNNGTGIVTTNVGPSWSWAASVNLQNDGGIVLAGTADSSAYGDVFAAVRYVAEDVTPNAFAFNMVGDARSGNLIESNTVTLTGFDTPTQIRAYHGPNSWDNLAEYRINNGDWTREPGYVNPGDRVQVRHHAGINHGDEVRTTLSAGMVRADFVTVTTRDSGGGSGALSIPALLSLALPLLLIGRFRRR